MKSILILTILVIASSCAKKVIGVKEFCKSDFKESLPAKLDLSGGIAFKNHMGELLVDSSKCLPSLVGFLQQSTVKKIEVVVYHTFGSERFYKEGMLKSGNLKKYLVSNGIDASKISFSTFLDKKSSYKYESIYRKVEVLLKY